METDNFVGNSFFMAMLPPTKTNQAKGINFDARKVYTTAAMRDVEAKFDAHLFRHRPSEPVTGPIRLEIYWFYPPTGRHKGGEWKTTKPDVDNAVKTLIDRMTRLGFWKDDSQIAALTVSKSYLDVPGVYVGYYRMDKSAVKSAEMFFENERRNQQWNGSDI